MKRSIVAVLAFLSWAGQAHGADQLVTDLTDSGSGCLRAKLTACINSGGGTITFASGLSGTILLNSALPTITLPGPPSVSVTIDGGNAITISGNNAYQIFVVADDGTLVLKNMTLTHAYSAGDGAAISSLGTVTAANVKFLNNMVAATSSASAILCWKPLTLTGCEFGFNIGGGGAVKPRSGTATTTITNCNFHDNQSSVSGSGTGYGGAMQIFDGPNVTITGTSFTTNTAANGNSYGGAIYVTNNASLTINAGCTFSHNTSTSYGGAIASDGSVTIHGATFDTNTAGDGGAIWTGPTANLTMDGSLLTGQTATLYGGAMYLQSTANITQTTISGNTARYGAGVWLQGASANLTLSASTISGNTVFTGAATDAFNLPGGIGNTNGRLTATNVTISGNSSNNTGGAYAGFGATASATFLNCTIAFNNGSDAVSRPNGDGTVTLTNTIISHGTRGTNCYQVSGGSFNLSDDGTCGFGIGRDNVTNLLLSPLANNGGPTQTHLPQPGNSAAIDNATASGAPSTDQRALPRPQGAAYDVGAVEVQPSDNATPTPTPTPTATPTATPVATATPTVTPGLVGNVSTRLPVGTDENVLIEGFIVQGPQGSGKKIMVRAIGPSLAAFGITDALANPTLEIHDASGITIATNNDWKVTQTGGLITGDQATEIGASGLAPANDLESAIIVNLVPGSYTAVVRGVNNTIGTGVVDAYDLNGGSAAKLANIATRGLVQPGDKLMIAGFIIQNGAVRAVVRAIGPSLLAFGISNALPDTTLQLRDQNGAIVVQNDNWKIRSDGSSQQAELEATGLQPTNDLEAAFVTTLQPGPYTAQLRGNPESTGIGVVQVYFIE